MTQCVIWRIQNLTTDLGMSCSTAPGETMTFAPTAPAVDFSRQQYSKGQEIDTSVSVKSGDNGQYRGGNTFYSDSTMSDITLHLNCEITQL